MQEFLSLIYQFLSIRLTLGGVEFSIGSILGFILIVKYAYARFWDDMTISWKLDEYSHRQGFRNWDEYKQYHNYNGGHDAKK